MSISRQHVLRPGDPDYHTVIQLMEEYGSATESYRPLIGSTETVVGAGRSNAQPHLERAGELTLYK